MKKTIFISLGLLALVIIAGFVYFNLIEFNQNARINNAFSKLIIFSIEKLEKGEYDNLLSSLKEIKRNLSEGGYETSYKTSINAVINELEKYKNKNDD